MKLTKGEFRLMIKECIRELITEGAFNQILTESISGNVLPNSNIGTISSQQSMMNSVPQQSNLNPHLNNLIQNTAKMVTAAKPQQAGLYAALLEDTAKTTLQKMILNDTQMRGGGGNMVVEDNTPLSQHEVQDLQALSVGGDMKRWAAIAMGGQKR